MVAPLPDEDVGTQVFNEIGDFVVVGVAAFFAVFLAQIFDCSVELSTRLAIRSCTCSCSFPGLISSAAATMASVRVTSSRPSSWLLLAAADLIEASAAIRSG